MILPLLTDILRFDIGVDKVTLVMQVLQTLQNLLANHLDQSRGNPGGFVPFNERKQVLTKWLED